MMTTELCYQFALERCRMYLAQLCAANHFASEDNPECIMERDTVVMLLKGLEQDLDILEALADASQG